MLQHQQFWDKAQTVGLRGKIKTIKPWTRLKEKHKALEKSSNIQEFSRYFKDPQAVFNKTVDFILDSDLASKIDLDDWHNTGDKVWNDFRWFATPRTLQQLYMKLRNFL